MLTFTVLGKLSLLSLKNVISHFIHLYNILKFSQAKLSDY